MNLIFFDNVSYFFRVEHFHRIDDLDFHLEQPVASVLATPGSILYYKPKKIVLIGCKGMNLFQCIS